MTSCTRVCAVAALLLVCAAVTTHGRTLLGTAVCPGSLDTVKDFDLAKYIAAPWYSLEQVQVQFQRSNSFYCTRARYIPVDPTDLQKGIDVVNYANEDRVNGRPLGVSGAAGNTSFSLFAVVAPTSGPTAASKLLVGPKAFVSRAPAAAVAQQLKAPVGNYRVVAVGPSKDAAIGYDWAIIVGGTEAPSEKTDKGLCGPSKANDEGLWLFHRNPLAPAYDIELMKKTALKLGIDTSRLEPVEHKGCKYEGSDPSPAAQPAAAQPSTQPAAAPVAPSTPNRLVQASAQQTKKGTGAGVGGCKKFLSGWLWLPGKSC